MSQTSKCDRNGERDSSILYTPELLLQMVGRYSCCFIQSIITYTLHYHIVKTLDLLYYLHVDGPSALLTNTSLSALTGYPCKEHPMGR